ncbi:MAG: type II secretion system protein [Planctomycetes bacterium]|nr:type II secretion system protein [Planctomycetota bacterium]
MTRRAGFSLVELLVVMAILSVLGGLAVIGLPRMLRAGDKSLMENVILQLDAALQSYEADSKNGDYPPTLLDSDEFPGVGQRINLDNCGNESIVLCLNRRGHASRFDIEGMKGVSYTNIDADRTQAVLTSFSNDDRELYELVDVWGMPIAYFHHRDYGVVESRDLGRTSGVEDLVKAVAWTNPKTRNFYQRDKFQIISAGPDMKFNTEDDITNFERE